MFKCLPQILLLCTLTLMTLSAKTIHVNANAAPGGDGSAAQPFQSIQKAVRQAGAGDTVEVEAGLYREDVRINQGGAPDAPLTVRAAKGERVIITGADPITGWQAEGDGVYVAEIDWPARQLTVGGARLELARWPADGRWMDVTADKDDGREITFSAPDDDWTPQGNDMFLFGYRFSHAIFIEGPIQQVMINGDNSAVQSKPLSKNRKLLETGDRFQIINPSNARLRLGQWTYQDLGEGRTRLRFRPENPGDLDRTEAPRRRAAIQVTTHQGDISHLRIRGFELSAGVQTNLIVRGAKDLLIEDCVSYGSSLYHAANIDNSEGVTIRRCIFAAAGTSGLAIRATKDFTVEHCEVAWNDVDGLTIAGNPRTKVTVRNFTVRENYIHHHIFAAHPDNMQYYSDVAEGVVENNLITYTNQGLMTSDTERVTLRGNVFLGAMARHLILGHKSANEWTVEGNTFALAHFGGVGVTGTGSTFEANIFYDATLGDFNEIASANYDLFFDNQGGDVFFTNKNDEYTGYKTAEAIYASTGLEQYGRVQNPQFRNAPVGVFRVLGQGQSSATRLKVRNQVPRHSSVGDHIEIDGDGVARRVTNIEDEYFSIEPALPTPPLRTSLVTIWSDPANLQIDTRPRPGSPALTAGPEGKPVGAQLEIAAYQRGDFNGDGQRDLPELSPEFNATLASAVAKIIPYRGLDPEK